MGRTCIEVVPGHRFVQVPENYFIKGESDRKPTFKPKLLSNEIVEEMDLRGESKKGPFYYWDGSKFQEVSLVRIREIITEKLGIEYTRARTSEVEWLIKLELGVTRES